MTTNTQAALILGLLFVGSIVAALMGAQPTF
jgi:hypothetical protein